MNNLTNFLHGLIKVFGTTVLAALMLMTFTDVTLRYVFSNPILGSNEITQFLLAAAVFSGLAIVSGERSHIVVTLFEPILIRKIPFSYKWIGILTNLIGICAVWFLVVRYTIFVFEQEGATEIREWSWWWLGVVLSVLSFFAILLAIRAISAPIRDKPADLPESHEA